MLRFGGGFTIMRLTLPLGPAFNHAATGAPPDRVLRIDALTSGAAVRWDMVEQPTKLEFAVNLKKANAMGIEIPRAALMRADWVVR